MLEIFINNIYLSNFAVRGRDGITLCADGWVWNGSSAENRWGWKRNWRRTGGDGNKICENGWGWV